MEDADQGVPRARRAGELFAELRRESAGLAQAEREMGSRTTLAINVLRRRVRRGWTLPELAERAGLAKSCVFAVESGTANATLATLDRLAAALDCDPADLLQRESPAPPPSDQA